MRNHLLVIIHILNELMGKNHEDHEAIEITELDFNDLYQLISYYGLNELVYPVVSRYFNKTEDNELLLNWTNSIKKTGFYNIIVSQQMNIIMSLLRDHHIQSLVIKGLAISRFYEKPEYRRMSDLDILVHENELQKTKEILVNSGYAQVEEDDYNPLHIRFEKSGFIAIEIHKNLIHTGYLSHRESKEWYKHIWFHKQKIKCFNIIFFAMCEEDEIINQITHFASHFVYVGTKLSHIFELALIINSTEGLHWSYMTRILKTLRLDKFADLLFSICKTYFHANIPSYITTVSIKNQKRFIHDLVIFSYEKIIGDFRGWRNIVSRYRFIPKCILYNPLISIIEISSQFQLHGMKPFFIIKNAVKNILANHKKMKIVRDYELILQDDPLSERLA